MEKKPKKIYTDAKWSITKDDSGKYHIELSYDAFAMLYAVFGSYFCVFNHLTSLGSMHILWSDGLDDIFWFADEILDDMLRFEPNLFTELIMRKVKVTLIGEGFEGDDPAGALMMLAFNKYYSFKEGDKRAANSE